MSVFFDKQKQRWRVELTRDGKRHTRLAPAGATKEEAEAYEAQVKLGHWHGELGKKQERTIDEAFTRWFNEELPKRRAQEKVISHAKALASFLSKYHKDAKLTDAHLVARDYISRNERVESPATIYQRLSILRRIANLAYRQWDWLDQPVGTKIIMPRIKNERHVYITKEQMQTLVDLAPQQWLKDAILIGVYTGMRQSDVVALTPESVKGDLLQVWDSKTEKWRMVPIHPAIEDALTRLPLGVTKWAVSHGFTKVVRGAGLENIHYHDLRHSCASWLAQAGQDLYTIGCVLGHASPATTKRYAHLSVDNLRNAIRKLA